MIIFNKNQMNFITVDSTYNNTNIHKYISINIIFYNQENKAIYIK